MTIKIKQIIKKIFIVVYTACNILFLNWLIFSRTLFALGNPDKELERAIDFMKDEQYIGMTLEECEVIFGDSGLESPKDVVVYPAGTFQDGWWPGQYEIVIYFDINERVKYVRLQDIKE